MKVIGLVGEKGGGKGTFSVCLRNNFELSVAHLKFSDVLVDMLKLLSLPITRENLQKAAQMIDEKFGEGTFSNAVYRRVLNQFTRLVILDGVRWLPDEQLIRRFEDNVLVYVTADADTRFERLKARNEKVGEGEMTREQFDREEMAPNELLISEIGARADFHIINNGSFEEFEDQERLFRSTFLS